MKIDTSLLRERFVIEEKSSRDDAKALKLTVPSTRMSINLQAGEMPEESYVVRSGNMHSCTRLVSQLVSEYDKGGPLLSRAVAIDWSELWHNATSAHERLYNNERWYAIYHKGKIIYSEGKHHPFLDIIEKCDVINKGDYDKSIKMAESAFSQAGKNVDIECDSNVALVAIIGRDKGRCSMVLREPGHTTTCNYSIKPLKKKINLAQGLSTAADVFEGVALSFVIGKNGEELEQGLIEKYSDKDREARDARKRVYEINAQISSFENRYEIRYRPERPDFDRMIANAERFIRDELMKKAADENGGDGT